MDAISLSCYEYMNTVYGFVSYISDSHAGVRAPQGAFKKFSILT